MRDFLVKSANLYVGRAVYIRTTQRGIPVAPAGHGVAFLERMPKIRGPCCGAVMLPGETAADGLRDVAVTAGR